MIRHPKDEIVVAYNDREVQELLEGEDFIIAPDGEGRSVLYLFRGAEGSVLMQTGVQSVLYEEVFEDDYSVLKLSAVVEEVQTMLTDVRFVFPEAL